MRATRVHRRPQGARALHRLDGLEQINDALAAARALASGDEPMALSCGVAALRPGARPAELFRAADNAQYAAKREGGGRIVVAEGETPDRSPAEARVLAQRLLDLIAHAPEGEQVERLAGALKRA